MVKKSNVRISVTISKDLEKMITDICNLYNENGGLHLTKSQFMALACWKYLQDMAIEHKRQKEVENNVE